MTVFEKVTAENTIPTLKMAAERAKQDGVHLVVASTGGDTALKAVEAAKEAGVLDKLVIVGSVQSRGVQKMAPETLQMLKELGVPVVRTTHVLSGADGRRVPGRDYRARAADALAGCEGVRRVRRDGAGLRGNPLRRSGCGGRRHRTRRRYRLRADPCRRKRHIGM